MKLPGAKTAPNLQENYLEWWRNFSTTNMGAVLENIVEYNVGLITTTEQHGGEDGQSDTDWLQTHMRLAECRKRYESRGDTIALIEALLLSIQTQWFPPPWALVQLHGHLAEWYEAQGEKSMDECFRLKPGTGEHSPPMIKDQELRRNGFLCYQIFMLQSFVPKLPVSEAATAVCNNTVKVGESPLRMIGAGTLNGHYTRTWRRIFEADGAMQEFRKLLKQWPENKQRKMLAAYGLADKYIPVKVQRPCLKCDRAFQSDGFFICPSCRKENVHEIDD